MGMKIELWASNATALAAVSFVLKLLGMGNFVSEAKFNEPNLISRNDPSVRRLQCVFTGRATSGESFAAGVILSFLPTSVASRGFTLLSAQVSIERATQSSWGEMRSETTLDYNEEGGFFVMSGPSKWV